MRVCVWWAEVQHGPNNIVVIKQCTKNLQESQSRSDESFDVRRLPRTILRTISHTTNTCAVIGCYRKNSLVDLFIASYTHAKLVISSHLFIYLYMLCVAIVTAILFLICGKHSATCCTGELDPCATANEKKHQKKTNIFPNKRVVTSQYRFCAITTLN